MNTGKRIAGQRFIQLARQFLFARPDVFPTTQQSVLVEQKIAITRCLSHSQGSQMRLVGIAHGGVGCVGLHQIGEPDIR